MRDIHVMHVLGQLDCGGVELALTRLLAEPQLAAMTHSIVAIRGEPTIADRFAPDVRLYCLHSPPGQRLLAWRLGQVIRQARPTVIHARNWGGWCDVALARLMLLTRRPLVYSFHGHSETQTPLRRQVAGRLFARTTRRIFTVSENSRRALAQHLCLNLLQIDVIPNGVDTQRFAPPDGPAVHPRPVVVSVGNLTAVKDHATLIRAFAEVIHSGLDLELWLAGEGDQRPALTGLIGELGLTARVKLLGHVQDVAALLRQADLFVLSSRSEAHPNALLEAMSCGLPCVATRVGGVAQVLGSGCCGVIVPPQAPGELAQAIATLAGDGARRRELGQAARQQVCRQYGLDQMAQAYAQLYRSVGRP